MSLPSAASSSELSALRQVLLAEGIEVPSDAPAYDGAEITSAGVLRPLGSAVYRARRVLRLRAGRVLRRAVQIGSYDERVRLDVTEARVSAIGAQMHEVRESAILAAGSNAIQSNRINIELLKAEFRSLLNAVEELGMAFAPATGWAGAGARFAELREQVNAVERRLREAQNAASRTGAPAVAQGESAAPPARTETSAAEPRSELFSYVAFERRFRGDPAVVSDTLVERYGDILAAHQPVVDLGCGRAELLEVLASRGVDCVGVDTDSGMVADARARGLRIEHTDAISFLRAAAPHSLGAVFSAHVAEHLHLDDLISMIELSREKLKPGGVFIAETPNPASLIVLGNSFILDPTHVWPLHPSLMAFLCETAGYRDVRLAMHSPATAYHLAPVDAGDGPEWAQDLAHAVNDRFGQLNSVLFGPQEYAVIAITPPAPAADAADKRSMGREAV